MRKLMCGCVVLLFVQALGAQAPLKTIEDGALDNISFLSQRSSRPRAHGGHQAV